LDLHDVLEPGRCLAVILVIVNLTENYDLSRNTLKRPWSTAGLNKATHVLLESGALYITRIYIVPVACLLEANEHRNENKESTDLL
jgi:hypothetical protein